MSRPSHSTDQHIFFQKFRSPQFLQSGFICNLLPFLDKTCSCDLISLGQEISMLFNCFSTFLACSTDKWYPHSWMMMVDLSSGPCIAKLLFRDLNSFYLSAWSLCVSLMGIYSCWQLNWNFQRSVGLIMSGRVKGNYFQNVMKTIQKETIQIKTLRKGMQMGSQISVSTPLPFPLSYCPSAPWSSPLLTLVCPFRLVLINV